MQHVIQHKMMKQVQSLVVPVGVQCITTRGLTKQMITETIRGFHGELRNMKNTNVFLSSAYTRGFDNITT